MAKNLMTGPNAKRTMAAPSAPQTLTRADAQRLVKPAGKTPPKVGGTTATVKPAKKGPRVGGTTAMTGGKGKTPQTTQIATRMVAMPMSPAQMAKGKPGKMPMAGYARGKK